MEFISGDVCGDYLCAGHIDNWPSGTTEEEQQQIINKVEQLIDKVTETKWGGEALDIKLNGNGKNRLFLPLEADILTVTNVYIHCIELDPSWYTWDINSVYLDPCASGAGILSPELYYKLAETLDRGIFPRGYNNIWVKGMMGESGGVPEAIKQAAVIIARWENDPTLYTYTGLKKSEKIGDYSYSMLFSPLTGGAEEVLTGIMEADTLLRLYIKRKAILMAP